jgi:preprotein translocase subunit SecD
MRRPVKYLLVVLCGLAALAIAFFGMLMLPLLWQPEEIYRSEGLEFRLVVQREADVWSDEEIRAAIEAFEGNAARDNSQIVWREWAVSMAPPPEAVQRREGKDLYVAVANSEDMCLLRDQRFPSWEIVSCRIGRDHRDRPALDFHLSREAGRVLAELTQRYGPSSRQAGRRAHLLAIVIDGKIRSAARIETQLGKRFQLTGDWTLGELRELRNRLVTYRL